jgi:hypothetical protein
MKLAEESRERTLYDNERMIMKIFKDLSIQKLKKDRILKCFRSIWRNY